MSLSGKSHWILTAVAFAGVVLVGLALSSYSQAVTALGGVLVVAPELGWNSTDETARVCLGFSNETGVRVYMEQAAASVYAGGELLFVTPQLKFNQALQPGEPVRACGDKQPGVRAREILERLDPEKDKWRLEGTAWLSVGPQSLRMPLRFEWTQGEEIP